MLCRSFYITALSFEKMSELVRNDVSSESICTVIENCTGNARNNSQQHSSTSSHSHNNSNNNNEVDQIPQIHESNIDVVDHCQPTDIAIRPNSSLCITAEDTCDTSLEETYAPQVECIKPRTKLKKSVSFDPQDEKIRKFTTGEPIVDQRNPFKSYSVSASNSLKKKKTPPPVPAKRSTLSVRKTVTQQLREREREKEKERERLKNETNNRKTITNGNNGTNLSSPDDFITTEEVLKQSKYVKTYIKNPDPYFVYDPTILARIKFEELRELADKKPPKKLKLTAQTKERIKDLKNKPSADISLSQSRLPFKKCSKPNYPDLSDIKIKVGTELDGNYFNPAEVSKNAKKFDDRVKKLHIAPDDDLDEIDGPLTKSESSDEVTANSNNKDSTDKEDDELPDCAEMNGDSIAEQEPTEGTFTNTIKSKEFQEYLEKKGLTLIPQKIPNGARSVYANGTGTSPGTHKHTAHISFKSPESVQISVDNMDAARNAKKPSVFQRLLSNSIFASRRKTTPKETVPTPRTLYDSNTKARENGSVRAPTAIKRVVLERQSFHGRPRASNLLTPTETSYLKNQTDRSRKSFASGDDLSVSISSALTNAEYTNTLDRGQADSLEVERYGRRGELQTAPIAKPPRRTLSRDRLSHAQQMRQQQQQQQQHDTILKPKVLRPQVPNNTTYDLSRDKDVLGPDEIYFRRGLERQSLIPKRTTLAPDKRQMFGRSSSMDRNEILKRRTNRNLQGGGSKSDNETSRVSTLNRVSTKENVGAKLTSTPLRDVAVNQSHINSDNHLPQKPSNKIYVDQQEWERLKAMKERTDHELYYRMLQQQQQQHQQQQKQQQQKQPQRDLENIYERLPAPAPTQLVVLPPPNQPFAAEGNFIRGSPQRNTFAGVTRNRQAKIIDGRAVLAADYPPVSLAGSVNGMVQLETTPRSQSVLDGMTLSSNSRLGHRRGYESDTETPVVLRRRDNKNEPVDEAAPPRRIGGILTREEILQKVKEFCRKSLNKTPTNQAQMQAIYEKQHGTTDLSPVSYASVETHQRPGSRMHATPQVPQRMQSLPQSFIPITQQISSEPLANTASPIYAHVVKRSSLVSNQSELYDSPQQPRPYVMRRESDAQTIYVSRGSLHRPEPTLLPTQYVLVDGEKLLPAQLVNYYPADIYAQPQYIRPYKLQPMPGAYGYITVREPLQLQQQQLRPRLHDGRSTPLILDRSSQQASQIYWTPQHQRLQQQHTGLLPVEISPRYTLKQPLPVPAPRTDLANRATKAAANNIPTHQQVQQVATLGRGSTSARQPLQQVQHVRQATTTATINELHAQQHAYEWESGSEAGEVQRIMENQRNSGELKARNLLRNLKTKVTRLMARTK